MITASTKSNAHNSRKVIEDTTALGIDPDSKFAQEIPIYDHNAQSSFQEHVTFYDESTDNNITLGNMKEKAKAAFEVMQKSQAVVVEVEPWFVNNNMATEDFDRWEPFFVAFPEVADDRQMKFTNLAPLSEVAYRIKQRDQYLEEASDEPVPGENDRTHPVVKAQMEEQKAFTRYSLDAFYNGDGDDEDGAWVDMSPIHAIHTVLSPWSKHLIIGGREDGSLYCGRGPLFDSHVDVAIDLDRKINKHGERKIAVYNDKSKKDAMTNLDFNETHARYLGEKGRWEIDLDAIESVVRDLLAHQDIKYVSLHRITEKAYVTHKNPELRQKIEGYPGFE